MTAHHWAKPGVKCVCVDASWLLSHKAPISVGGIYTIERVVVGFYGAWSTVPINGIWVVLREISNPLDYKHGAFASNRFRPLVTASQDDDIALFAPLLDTSRVTERA